MSASKSFNQWRLTENGRGKARIVEFKLERCVGRLRTTHIYSDTIKIAKEMLAEEGMEGKFGDMLMPHVAFGKSQRAVRLCEHEIAELAYPTLGRKSDYFSD